MSNTKPRQRLDPSTQAQINQLWAEAERHRTAAKNHASRAEKHRTEAEYLELLASSMYLGIDPPDQPPGRLVKIPDSVRIWREWLGNNGPNVRSDIQLMTRTRFAARAYHHTILWTDDMLGYSDSEFPADQIVRMKLRRTEQGRGGAPTAFFLWSQRHEAMSKYPQRRTGTQ